MLCVETILIFKLTIFLIWLDIRLSCDLSQNVTYTVLSNKNFVGNTSQQPVLVSKSGEKQYLNIIFNLSCTSSDTISSNVSIRFLCASCFWIDININNVQLSSALKLGKNEDLLIFSNAKIISLNFSWIQVFNKNLYDDLRFVINRSNEVLLNDSLVKLNIYFSCEEIHAKFLPDVIVFQNNSFPIKINWKFPLYEDATYLVELLLQFPTNLTVFNFNCTTEFLPIINLNFVNITHRFNLTSSLECEFLVNYNKLMFPGFVSYINISITYSTNVKQSCFYEEKKNISFYYPASNITWVSNQELSKLNPGDEINITLSYLIPRSYFDFNINIYEKDDLVSDKENVSTCLFGIHFPSSDIWLLMVRSSVFKKASIKNYLRRLFFSFGVIQSDIEEELVFNITFRLSSDFYCLPGKEINLIIESDIGDISTIFKIEKPIFIPDLMVFDIFEVVGAQLFGNITITHSPSSLYSARDVQVIYECNGMEVTVVEKNPLKLSFDNIYFPYKHLLREIKGLNVGESASILISGYFYYNDESSFCDQKIYVYWKSQQFYSPLFGPKESETILVQKKTVYNNNKIPNYGFIFLGFFMGILLGALCCLIIVCCFRRFPFSKKYNLQKNEVNITDDEHQSNLLSSNNFYPCFDYKSPKESPKRSIFWKTNSLSDKSIISHQQEIKHKDLWRAGLMCRDKTVFHLPKIIGDDRKLLNNFLLNNFHQLWIYAIKTSFQSMHDSKDISYEYMIKTRQLADKLLTTLKNHLRTTILDDKREKDLVAEVIFYSYKQGLYFFEDALRLAPRVETKVNEKKKSVHHEKTEVNKYEKYKEDLNKMFKILCDKLIFDCLFDANGCYTSSYFSNLSSSLFLVLLEEFMSLFTPWVNHVVSKQLDMLIRKRYITKSLSKQFEEIFIEELKHVTSYLEKQSRILVEKFEEKQLLSYLNQMNALFGESIKSLDSLWDSSTSFTQTDFVANTETCLKCAANVIHMMKENKKRFHYKMVEINAMLIDFLQNTMNIFVTRLKVHSENLIQNVSINETRVVNFNDKSLDEEEWFAIRFKKDCLVDLIQFLRNESFECFNELSLMNDVYCLQVEKYILQLYDTSFQKLSLIKSTLANTVVLAQIFVKCTIYCSGPVAWISWEHFWSDSSETTLFAVINKFVTFDHIKAIDTESTFFDIIKKEKINHIWLKKKLKDKMVDLNKSIDSVFEAMKDPSYDSEDVLMQLYKTNNQCVNVNEELSSNEILLDLLKNFIIGILTEAEKLKNEQLVSYVNDYIQKMNEVFRNSTSVNVNKVIMDSLKLDLHRYQSFCKIFLTADQLPFDIYFNEDEITEYIYHLGLHHQFKENKASLYKKMISEHVNFIKILHSNHFVEVSEVLKLLGDLANLLSQEEIDFYYNSLNCPLMNFELKEIYSSSLKSMVEDVSVKKPKKKMKKLKNSVARQ